MGVDVFFVISGYLISSVILQEAAGGSFSLAAFYQRRIARICPAFFMVGLATLLGASLVYTPEDLTAAGANLAAAALSVANMKFISQGNYFRIAADAQPFLHYWSLSVEEQFYLLYPLFVMLALRAGRRGLAWLAAAVGAASFLLCVWLTRTNAAAAYYLLPTRAWELLAGGLLAMLAAQSGATQGHATQRGAARRGATWRDRCPAWVHGLGLALIGLSLVVIREGPGFPGLWAVLPVVGAVCVLWPVGRGPGVSEKWLALAPLVLVGRMSYSLYLWHWPVFSLVDYQMYLAPEYVRLVLKIGLSILAAALSFWLIEKPARMYLNRRPQRALAFGFLLAAVAVCVPLGIATRNAHYVSVAAADVIRGGQVFDAPGVVDGPRIVDAPRATGSVVLMGDSVGAMYAQVTRQICATLGCKLSVICVAGGDPLPPVGGDNGRLWADSLAVVQREKPACLILACRWEAKLQDGPQRLARAIEALQPHAGRLLILNQPPILPAGAGRESLRQGARLPFREGPKTRRCRLECNDYLERFVSPRCEVVDVASHFETADGAILFLDPRGRQLYQDRTHLSGFGAELVRGRLQQAIDAAMPKGNAAAAGSQVLAAPVLGGARKVAVNPAAFRPAR